jgi:NAD(P)-dependent dehydrogenase (short-subunit alcohol dehydrogenase family)
VTQLPVTPAAKPGGTDPALLALVTGAASGVGLATTRCLLGRGSSVIGVDLVPQPDALPAGPRLAWITGDVSAEPTWARALTLAEGQFGTTPGVLILNAAKLAVGTVLETPVDTFRQVFEVNVYAAVLGLQACLPSMIGRGAGSVVVVASVNGLQAEQDLAAYNSSKGALVQLVRSAAIDHARDGVRINAVCPSTIDTPFIRGQVDSMPDPAAFRAEMEARHPLGRILDPAEVASVVVFLSTSEASGMTGASVVVDLGLTASPDFIPPATGDGRGGP